MEGHSAKRGMNILVNLGSFLLCEAFGRLLDKELEGHRVLASNLADTLCISEQTVKSHFSRIFRKTNVNNTISTRPARP